MSDSPRENQPVDQSSGTELSDVPAVRNPAFCWVAIIGFGGALLLCVLNVPRLFHNVGGSQIKQMILWGKLIGTAGGLVAAGAGVVGLFQTTACRRRGRLIAIAAIPLGLLAAFLQSSVGQQQLNRINIWEWAATATTVLATSPDEVRLQANADHFYQNFASTRFRSEVTFESFRQWVAEMLAKHGQLQSAPIRSREEAGEKTLIFHFTCAFVADKAEVKVVMGFADGVLRIDDIEVAGVSPRN